MRRDIQKDGFRTHQVHGKPTYQCYVKLPYTSIFSLMKIRSFTSTSTENQVVDGKSKCPFCKPSPKLKLLAETPLSYAVLDSYPVAKGHALIIPKRHIANYFDLTFDEQKDLVQLSTFVKNVVSTAYKTEDFTMGMNIGHNAGQRMDHATIHLIPRLQAIAQAQREVSEIF